MVPEFKRWRKTSAGTLMPPPPLSSTAFRLSKGKQELTDFRRDPSRTHYSPNSFHPQILLRSLNSKEKEIK
jgi:hypothetical protein